MKKEWNVEINGHLHHVSYSRGMWSSPEELIIDGQRVELVRDAGLSSLGGSDRPVMIEDRECRLVYAGRADFVVDGRYVSDGRPYVPVRGIPGWAWVIAVISLILPLIFTGGAVPTACGLLGAIFILRYSVKPEKKAGPRILMCLGIAAAAWAAAFLFYFFASSL